MSKVLIPSEIVENKIFLIRGQRVMMDRDLAELYGVETKNLNRQVKRNQARFPAEFMFQLTVREKDELVTICHQFQPSKHSSFLPYAFTEHGVAMMASVLRSDTAVQISILIVKTFIKLRNIVSTNKDLLYKLENVERKLGRHDEEIKLIFEAIRQLMAPPPSRKRKIGFYAR